MMALIEMLQPGDKITEAHTFMDHRGNEVALPSGGRALVCWGLSNFRSKGHEAIRVEYWQHGSRLRPTGCHQCQPSLGDLVPEFHGFGVAPYIVNYREPERNAPYADIGMFTIPYLTATREAAEAFAALRGLIEAAQSIPRQVAYLLDGSEVVKAWRTSSCPRNFPTMALAFVKERYGDG